MLALEFERFVTATADGLTQSGVGKQSIVAFQPPLFTVESLLNLKVKHPSAAVEVNGPGITVP